MNCVGGANIFKPHSQKNKIWLKVLKARKFYNMYVDAEDVGFLLCAGEELWKAFNIYLIQHSGFKRNKKIYLDEMGLIANIIKHNNSLAPILIEIYYNP